MKENWKTGVMKLARLIGLWVAIGGVVAGCDGMPECGPGEFRDRGRLPTRLFAFEPACQQSCLTSNLSSECELDCQERSVNEMGGALWGIADSDDAVEQIVDDRMLSLVDTGSLGGDRALVWEFGFIDAANGQAPVGWGFMRQGPRTYLSNEWEGSAHFVTRVGVATDLNGDGIYSLNPNDGEVAAAGSDVLNAKPGRLEILSTTVDSQTGIGVISGRFFLAFESLTERPESEVTGCFEISVAPATNDGNYRRPLSSW